MRLSQLVLENKQAVVESWYGHVLAAYPPETVKLWKSQKDAFRNPVGSTFLVSLDKLVDAVVAWKDAADMAKPLEDMVKIRAVQDMAPGKALAFVFALKKVLRELFAKNIAEEGLGEEVAMYDARADNLALMAFDVYTKSREAMFEMRVCEFKNAYHMAFRKAGITCESPREALGLEDDSQQPGQAR